MENVTKINKDETIDTGDIIKHIPSGETWVVAYERNGEVCCCGWPESFADTSDCVLIEHATKEKKISTLNEMSKLDTSDSRGRYALGVLG